MWYGFSHIYQTEIPVLDIRKTLEILKEVKNLGRENSNIQIWGFAVHMLPLEIFLDIITHCYCFMHSQ